MRFIVKRMPNRFYPDFKRVIIRFYNNDFERSSYLVNKVLEMKEKNVELVLAQTLREFSRRHRNITQKFMDHYEKVKKIVAGAIDINQLSEQKKLFIGSYFSMEYSIESAAFFNPSIVISPDQTSLTEGSMRIIVSFRATGEGHVSSIVFHTGIIDHNGDLHFEKPGYHVDEAEAVKRYKYNKKSFVKKLSEMNVDRNIISLIMEPLNDNFVYGELQKSVNEALGNDNIGEENKIAVNQIIWLADSHYKIEFSRDTHISERVIFPVSYSERKGIEDARFVRFIDDDGKITYYATYTAYDGHTIIPKIMVTKDFYNFEVKALHGEGAQNKNLAMFPRKINGKYVMLSRIDGINSFIGFSDNMFFWDKPVKFQEPECTWEFVQIGNCGAPVETSEGWLVITHGVGPMRKYCLGASLLDLNDPVKIVGRLKEPLLIPNEEEREGYVPNAVYSCGSIIHRDKLIIPYGLSDTRSGFVSVNVDKLLNKLLSG